MIHWWVGLITLFVGSGIGMFVTCLCVAAKNADYHIDNMEEYYENY